MSTVTAQEIRNELTNATRYGKNIYAEIIKDGKRIACVRVIDARRHRGQEQIKSITGNWLPIPIITHFEAR